MTQGRLATLVCCIGACVLAGCVGDTDPASNVRATQAQLNAHGRTNNGPASWWWEYGVNRSTVAGGGGTRTPRQGPASSPNDVNLSTVVRNLDPDQAYFFRACGQDAAAGSPVMCGRVRELLHRPQRLIRGGQLDLQLRALRWPRHDATRSRGVPYRGPDDHGHHRPGPDPADRSPNRVGTIRRRGMHLLPTGDARSDDHRAVHGLLGHHRLPRLPRATGRRGLALLLQRGR